MRRIAMSAAVNVLEDAGIHVRFETIVRNGEMKIGIVRSDTDASPILYDDHMYNIMDECCSEYEFIKCVEGFFNDPRTETVKKMLDKDFLLSHIIPVLYGGEYAKQLMEEDAVCREFSGDVSVFFRVITDIKK